MVFSHRLVSMNSSRREIEVSHALCKHEFARNDQSHRRGVFNLYIYTYIVFQRIKVGGLPRSAGSKAFAGGYMGTYCIPSPGRTGWPVTVGRVCEQPTARRPTATGNEQRWYYNCWPLRELRGVRKRGRKKWRLQIRLHTTTPPVSVGQNLPIAHRNAETGKNMRDSSAQVYSRVLSI